MHTTTADIDGSDIEKTMGQHVEAQTVYSSLNPEDADFLATYPLDKQKRAIRKVDVSGHGPEGLKRF